MAGRFAPEAYKDEYQQKLRDLITKKIEGEEIVAEKEEKPSNVINLMDALKQSLAQQEKDKAPPAQKQEPARRKKTG